MTIWTDNCNWLCYDIRMGKKVPFEYVSQWIAVIVLGVTPIFFLPFTQDFYDTHKLTALVFSAVAICMLWGVGQLVRRKPVTVHVTPGVLAFGGLLIASLLSFALATTGRVDALMAPLGSVSLLSLVILLIALSRPSDAVKSRLGNIFLGSTAVLGLIALYLFVGMGKVMFPGVPYLQDGLWTPTGNSTTTIALFAVALALLVPRLRASYGRPHLQNKLIFSIAALLCIVAGGAVTVWQFIPKFASSVIPLPAAWTVTLETLKHGKAAFVGSGVENFLTAYTAGKPLWLSTTDLWNVRFGVNADLFLHMAAVYGLAGLAAALFFAWHYLRQLSGPSAAASLVYVLCLFLVPPTLTLLATGAVLLVLVSDQQAFSSKPLPVWAGYVLSGILLLAGAGGLYFAGRAYLGERQYYMALVAAQKNEGTNTYNLHIAAIKTNPYVTRYHVTFSQVNLSLANSIASQANEQSKSSTSGTQSDQNTQLINQLIQQAIAEGKTAVTLNSQNITAWENLGTVYQVLMPVAQGSDAWAAAAFQKALTLDPTNPVLSLDLGGALVHEKKYDDAIAAFTQAIFVRPDYANAYYNMGNAYRLKGDMADAKAAFTKTMSLVTPGTSDYTKIQNELSSLETGSPPVPSTSSGALTLPK